MTDVKGKWALVTGASRGVGCRIARFMAPNDPDSVIPGICVGAFIDDKMSGRNLGAQGFCGMTLEAAVEKARSYPKLFE